MDEIQKILKGQDKQKILSVFSFSANDNEELIATKYDLFVRFFFPGIFLSDDAPFHREMILNTILAYQGKLDAFVNIAFRGAAKDAKTKPFVVFVILNDRDHYRRYIRVLSADLDNAVQFTTDIYNGLVSPRILQFYPHTFGGDKNLKRMERMGNFDTSASIKVEADSVGTGQRGKSQDIETMRPDFIVFNDIETRDTLWSTITTKKIADRIEEARTGLQKGGSAIYLANYISEMGNVHKLIKNKLSPRKKVLIIPIINDNGEITWNRYTLADIEEMKRTDDDFAGERLCVKPNTLIASESGLKEIKNIKIGDFVWTHLGQLQKVVRIFKSQAEDLIDITVKDETITITKNHPVLIKDRNTTKWVKAGELNAKDLIVYTHRDMLHI